jgi:hypothetical protein
VSLRAPTAPSAGAPERAPSTTTRRERRIDWPPLAILAAIVAGGLALRLLGLRHGLPYVYHPDEALHYTNRAVQMLTAGTLDPGYYQNPSGFTELVYAALLITGHRTDPTPVYLTARVVSVAMCMLAVIAVYGAGRRLWGRAEGLVAAAVLSFAFLTVAYSRFAVTDVSALAFVAVAAYFIVRMREDPRLRNYLAAGAAMGLAIGFKYTTGVLLAPLLLAALPHARRDRATALKYTAAALAIGLLAFFLTTPSVFVHPHSAAYQLKVQQHNASAHKLGQSAGTPFLFYPQSITWGLGWGAALAALLGAVLVWRRDRPRAALLLLAPLLLWLYLSLGADRWFARWLLPVYPILALLAGVGFVWIASTLVRRGRVAVLALLVAAALIQPVISGIHTGRVLARTDTRTLMRDYLFTHLRPDARIVVDPAVPIGFFGGHFAEGYGPPPKTAERRAGSPSRYIADLKPKRIEVYRRTGHCVVVELSLVRDRALRSNRKRAIAYYRALPREGRVIFHASPYKPGAGPVPFDFDFSTHLYYPSAYERPGPVVNVYRLDRCRQGYGQMPV